METVLIDWVTATKKFKGERARALLSYDDAATAAMIDLVPLLGSDVRLGLPDILEGRYPWAMKDRITGVTVGYSSDLQKQGAKLTATGRAMSEVRSRRGFLSEVLQDGWKPTRLDLAIDIMDPKLRIADIAAQAYQPRVNTRGLAVDYDVRRGGEMLTLGSRTSEFYIRIYNKALEQNVEGPWLRLEVELKGGLAVRFAAALAEDTRRIIPAIRERVGAMSKRLDRILSELQEQAQTVKPEPKALRTNATGLWLERSVAPAYARLACEDREAFVRATVALFRSVAEIGDRDIITEMQACLDVARMSMLDKEERDSGG